MKKLVVNFPSIFSFLEQQHVSHSWEKKSTDLFLLHSKSDTAPNPSAGLSMLVTMENRVLREAVQLLLSDYWDYFSKLWLIEVWGRFYCACSLMPVKRSFLHSTILLLNLGYQEPIMNWQPFSPYMNHAGYSIATKLWKDYLSNDCFQVSFCDFRQVCPLWNMAQMWTLLFETYLITCAVSSQHIKINAYWI